MLINERMKCRFFNTFYIEEDSVIEIVLIDATEQEIERPKKNKGNTTQGRKRNTL